MPPEISLLPQLSYDPRPLILWLLILVFVGGCAWLLSRWTQRRWKPTAGDVILFLVAAAFILDGLAHLILDRFGVSVAYIGGPLFLSGRYPAGGWVATLLASARYWYLMPPAVFAVLYLLLGWNAEKGPDASEMSQPQATRHVGWTQRLTGFLSSLVLVYAILAIFSIALSNRAAVLSGG